MVVEGMKGVPGSKRGMNKGLNPALLTSDPVILSMLLLFLSFNSSSVKEWIHTLRLLERLIISHVNA